jgi:hypothetical protein
VADVAKHVRSELADAQSSAVVAQSSAKIARNAAKSVRLSSCQHDHTN